MSATGKPRFLERFRRDVRRYFRLDSKDGNPGLAEKARILAHSHGLHAIAVYRFGAWVNANVQQPLVRYPLKLAYHVLDQSTVILWGIHIDEGADIGGGLYIPHPSGVLIGPTTIGDDCNVGHNVTIGRRTDGRNEGMPTLGDRVWIGAGSIVFGKIQVGTGTSVGPLTVVARNLPPRCLVGGNPLQFIRREQDNTHQIYGKFGPPEELDGPHEPRKVEH